MLRWHRHDQVTDPDTAVTEKLLMVRATGGQSKKRQQPGIRHVSGGVYDDQLREELVVALFDDAEDIVKRLEALAPTGTSARPPSCRASSGPSP